MLNDEISLKLRLIKKKFIANHLKMLNEYKLTKMEFDILNYIYFASKKNSNVQASGLAKFFDVSIPAVMHKLNDLESRGMILKYLDENDRRIKYYILTDDANLTLEKLFKFQEKRKNDFLEFLGDELNHLNIILDQTLNYLEVDNDKIIKELK